MDFSHDILGTWDSGGSNMFLYKEDFNLDIPTSSRLKLGPLWDFGTIYRTPDAWSRHHNSLVPLNNLEEREDFVNIYKSIWDSISPSLYDEIMNFIISIKDSIGDSIDVSRARTAEKYAINVSNIQTNIDKADAWFKTRLTWMNSSISELGTTDYTNYPINELEIVRISIYDIYGRLLNSCQNKESLFLNHENYPSGLYIIKTEYSNGQVNSSKVITVR